MPREAKIQKTGNSQDISVGKQVQDERDKAADEPAQEGSSSSVLDQDIDDLIGDLIKEELQLVITRLIRKTPVVTDDVKAEITRIIKARSKNAPLPLSRQIKQLQDLLQAQQASASGVNLVSLLGFGGQGAAASQLDATQLLGASMGGFSQLPIGAAGGHHAGGMMMMPQGFGGGDGFMPGLDVNAVRRKIRDAFIKTGVSRKRSQFGVDETKETFRVDSNIVRMELDRGNDLILQKNEVRLGLQIVEAITSEFTSRLAEIGDGYVSGFEDLLKRFNKSWVDIFLYRELGLDQQERDEWVTKLRSWDKSASEEEGTFASARYAARNGWDNTHLKNVLKGEGIGKFKEPRDLITERLNQLDREKKYEDGVHLAQACDMHFHAAKFLLTLDRKEEAEKAAELLEDSEKLFSIAQLARPLDVRLAFTLCIRSVARTNEWNAENQERSSYLVDMSISAKTLDLLVEQVETQIKNKTVQFNIAQILKNKEQYKHALSICKYVLKPYAPLELVPAPQQPEALNANGAAASTAPAAPTMVMPPLDPGRLVPNNCATWTWDLSYEMAVLEIADDIEMLSTLTYILNTVEDVNQLMALMATVNQKQEYDQVLTVGSKLFERVEQIRKREHALQLELINTLLDIQHNPEFAGNQPLIQQNVQIAQINFQTKVQQDNQLGQIYANQIFPSMNMNHNQNWDNYKNNICLQMINAALDSKNPALTVITPNINNARGKTVQPRKVKAIEASKLEQVLDLGFSYITNIDHKIQLTRNLPTRQEFKLALRAIEKVHPNLKELKAAKVQRDTEMAELQTIRMEIIEATNNRRPVRPEAKKRLRDLEYLERTYVLQSQSTNYPLQRYDDYHLQIALLAISTVITSKYHQDEAKRLTKEVIDETIVKQIEILERPSDLIRVCADLRARKEFDFVLRAAEKTTDIIDKMQKAREVRERARLPLEMLIEEQNTFTANKQPIPQHLQAEVVKLQLALDALPKAVYYDPNTPDEYDSLHYQVAEQSICAALDTKQPQPAANILLMQNAPQPVITPFTDDKIRQVINTGLVHVQNTQQMADISNAVASRYGEIEMGISITQRTQDRIIEVQEMYKQREKPRLHYLALLDEKRNIEEQKKQPVRPDLIKQIKEMDLEQRLIRSLLPSYHMRKLDQMENQLQSCTVTILNLLINRKRQYQTRLQQLLDMEQMGQEIMDTDLDENNKDKIQENIFNMNRLIRAWVDRSMTGYIKNPNGLINMATILRDNNEPDLVNILGKRVQARILEMVEDCKARQKVLDELEDLENEERELIEQAKLQPTKKKKLDAEKEKRKIELVQQRDYMNVLPAYTRLTEEQLEDVHLENARVLLTNVLKARQATENDVKLLPEEKDAKMAKHQEDILEIVDMCLKYVQNPKHILVLLDLISSKDLELVLKLGLRVLERLQTCIKLRHEFDVPEQTVNILQHEQTQLQLLRKTLDKPQQEKLDAMKHKKDNMDIPQYCLDSSHDDLQQLKYKAISKMMNVVMQQKAAFESRALSDQSLTPEQIDAENAKNAELVNRVVNILLREDVGIENPQNFNAFISDLVNKREYNHAIRVGDHAFVILKKMRAQYDARQLPEQHFALLDKENETLLQQRKQLPADKQEQLRELKLKHLINGLLPSYCNNGPEENDRLAYLIARSQITSALELKKDLESKMELESQQDEDENSKQSKAALERVKTVLEAALNNIFIIENIIKLAQELSEKLEYDLTLQVGKVCQKRVQELREKVKKIKELEEEKQALLQKIKLPSRTIEQQIRIQEIEIELAKLPLKYQNENTIDAFLLHVGKMMMNAAKVVNDNDVLLEQSVVVFKINMTQETFGEVKVLTPEDKWDKVRQQLLLAVMEKIRQKVQDMKDGKPVEDGEEIEVDLDVTADDDDSMQVDDDDSDDDSGYGRRKRKTPAKKATKRGKRRTSNGGFTVKKSTMKEMIELLLNEGCWKEVLAVFPDPQFGTMALLERLWIEVDQQNQPKLEELLPTVESYVTKECLTYDFNNANTILDMASQFDPDWEGKIIGNISEKLLNNIVQKQYNSFVDFLNWIRKRLTDKNKEKQWDKFIAALKKNHKQKKKLISIIEQNGL